MKVVFLCNSHDSVPLATLRPSEGPVHHARTPKGLLPAPAAGRLLIDVWQSATASSAGPPVVVINGASYMHYERWATSRGLPVDHLINDGSTTADAALGEAAALPLVERRRLSLGATASDGPTLVVAADTALSPEGEAWLHALVRDDFGGAGGDLAGLLPRLASEQDGCERAILLPTSYAPTSLLFTSYAPTSPRPYLDGLRSPRPYLALAACRPPATTLPVPSCAGGVRRDS